MWITAEIYEPHLVLMNVSYSYNFSGYPSPNITYLYSDGKPVAVLKAFLFGSAFMKLMFTVWIAIHLFALAVFHKNLQSLEPLYVVSSLFVPLVVTAALLGTNLTQSRWQEACGLREIILYIIKFLCLSHCSSSSWEPSSVIEHAEGGISLFLNMTNNIRRRCMRCYLFSCIQYCFSFLQYHYLSLLCSI